MLKRITLLHLLMIFLISCKNKNSVVVQQIKNDRQVYVRMKFDDKLGKNVINTIHIPFSVLVKNSSFQKTEIKRFAYLYDITEDVFNRRAKLYSIEGDKKQYLDQMSKKFLKAFEEREFLFYTNHEAKEKITIDQNKFDSFINEMVKNKTDSLVIGTLEEFKKEYMQLTEKLLSNERIVVTFDIEDKKVRNPYGKIDVLLVQKIQPVEY